MVLHSFKSIMAVMSNDYPDWLETIEPTKEEIERLEWLIPEQRSKRGHFSVVGGDKNHITRVQETYSLLEAEKPASVSILVPKSWRKFLESNPDAHFAEADNSGGFALAAEESITARIISSDGTIFPGDLGRNSQTAQAIERSIIKTTKPIVLSGDSLELIPNLSLLNRENTILICNFGQFQRLAMAAKITPAVVSDMPHLKVIEVLHELTSTYPAAIVIKHFNWIIASQKGTVWRTKIENENNTLYLGARSVFWHKIEQPNYLKAIVLLAANESQAQH
jgi:NAD(P)H-hydrate repair Nnr-like enzyme with NAD(P)H-hydrate dehydratase domain